MLLVSQSGIKGRGHTLGPAKVHLQNLKYAIHNLLLAENVLFSLFVGTEK